MSASTEHLQRGLGERHIRLMALAWAISLVTQIQFRRGLSAAERGKLAFRMPFWPYGSWIALAFLALVIALMAYFPDTRVALYVGPAWLVLLTVLYYRLGVQARGPVSYQA